MAFPKQIQHRFTGFEENLDLPAFPINTDDLFLGKGRIGADKSKPVLAVRFVSYTHTIFAGIGLSFPAITSTESRYFDLPRRFLFRE